MSSSSRTSFFRLAGLAAAVIGASAAVASGEPAGDYERLCATCHGKTGDGQGPMASYLSPPPRDFTANAYKFRSTRSGALPRDEDLLRVIEEGLPGTAMVGWRDVLPPERLRALVGVVKGFTPRFAKKAAPEPEALPTAPPADAQAVQRGRATYERMKCAECHGSGGRGDGPSVKTLVDDWSRPIRPSDLTRRELIRRRAVGDVAGILVTGMNGTPMPSYRDSITADELWDLARYLVSLQRETSCWERFLFDPPLTWQGDDAP